MKQGCIITVACLSLALGFCLCLCFVEPSRYPALLAFAIGVLLFVALFPGHGGRGRHP